MLHAQSLELADQPFNIEDVGIKAMIWTKKWCAEEGADMEEMQQQKKKKSQIRVDGQGLAVDWVLASIVVDICCWFSRVPAMNLTASGLDVYPLAVQICGKVGHRRLPFQASLATLVLVCPSFLLWRLGDVLEREWLSRRLVRRLEMPRHLSRCSLCHRMHTVALFRHHLLLR
ncbi:hypothetical protein Taro_021160 [Colocasia esculenta]|uniref:Uncharacterized protein n=1 Tax=Colocasia esculenta TaxID=4460 RepID=A0A843V7E7_COLES|nr:hypothetical protein [Colocasia esculenta]